MDQLAESADALSLADARDRLGHMWGLERPLTRAELARALMLSEEHGGRHIGKLEKAGKGLSGPAEVAIRMMIDGGRPFTMDGVIKPGYPRGPVR